MMAPLNPVNPYVESIPDEAMLELIAGPYAWTKTDPALVAILCSDVRGGRWAAARFHFAVARRSWNLGRRDVGWRAALDGLLVLFLGHAGNRLAEWIGDLQLSFHARRDVLVARWRLYRALRPVWCAEMRRWLAERPTLASIRADVEREEMARRAWERHERAVLAGAIVDVIPGMISPPGLN